MTGKILLLLGPVLPVIASQAAVDYAREVRPLLEARCYGCHGPKAKTHGLRLDRKGDALKGGDSGAPAVVPGKSAASLLYRYTAGLDPDIRMPKGGPSLSPLEVDLLKRWIDEGASWPEENAPAEARRGQNNWAFRPRQRPEPPRVRNVAWVRNPIDAFILSKLEAKGWKPSPAAAPRPLLRRAHRPVRQRLQTPAGPPPMGPHELEYSNLAGWMRYTSLRSGNERRDSGP